MPPTTLFSLSREQEQENITCCALHIFFFSLPFRRLLQVDDDDDVQRWSTLYVQERERESLYYRDSMYRTAAFILLLSFECGGQFLLFFIFRRIVLSLCVRHQRERQCTVSYKDRTRRIRWKQMGIERLVVVVVVCDHILHAISLY